MSAPKYEEFVARLTNKTTACDDQTPPRSAEFAQVGEPTGVAARTTATSNKLAPKLETITSKGLDKADQILDLPLDPDNRETFGPTLRAQTTIVGQALTTQVRVDENQMRAERPDALVELMRNIAEEQKRRLINNGEGNGPGP
jgi:hypothetical protein